MGCNQIKKTLVFSSGVLLFKRFFLNSALVFFLLIGSLSQLAFAEAFSSYAHADFLIRKDYKNSFSGLYTIQNGAQSKSFGIEHAYLTKGNHTILRSIGAPERAILFEDHRISFFAKNDKGFTQSNLDVLRKFPLLITEKNQKILENSYEIKKSGSFRVANRACDEITLVPKDMALNRYHQKLCVDRITKLVLKQIVFLSNEAPLETLSFSEIKFKKIPTEAFDSPKKFKSISHKVLNRSVGVLPKNLVDDLPKAFSVIAYNKVDQVQHFVLSDGFVYISLLIETTQNENEPIGSKAHYIDGALSFAINQTKDKKISALGFMPPSGLKELVSSVQ